MAISGHSKFRPVFLGKIVGKNSERPFLAIPNLYQSFWEKLLEKIWNSHSKFIPVFLGKIVRKNLEQPFLAILNYTSLFGKNCWKKIGMAIFGHSTVIRGRSRISHWGGTNLGRIHFLAKTYAKMKEIDPVGGHMLAAPPLDPPMVIPLILGKIVRKKSERPFLAIPNLYQFILGKIVRKNLEWPVRDILNQSKEICRISMKMEDVHQSLYFRKILKYHILGY